MDNSQYQSINWSILDDKLVDLVAGGLEFVALDDFSSD